MVLKLEGKSEARKVNVKLRNVESKTTIIKEQRQY